jgi:hypothetical protein
VAARHREVQGFIFDVIQDPCPYRLQSASPSRQKRFLHLLFQQNHLPVNSEAETFEQKEGPRAKFYGSNNPGVGVCVFNYLTLFQLKLESMLIPKEICLPLHYNYI